MRRTLFFIALCLFSLLAFQAAAGSSSSSLDPAVRAEAGALAPEVRVKNLQGESVLLSQYRGKVVMLNFWATWCPPCRAEMPSMERLFQRMQGEEFVILAVNTEAQGAQIVPAFLKSYPHSFPVLLDAEGKAQNAYGVYRFPETFIINKDGMILNHILGGREWDDPSTVDYFKFLSRG
jgi:thiol-disulfide isomerase/thioredoxin